MQDPNVTLDRLANNLIAWGHWAAAIPEPTWEKGRAVAPLPKPYPRQDYIDVAGGAARSVTNRLADWRTNRTPIDADFLTVFTTREKLLADMAARMRFGLFRAGEKAAAEAAGNAHAAVQNNLDASKGTSPARGVGSVLAELLKNAGEAVTPPGGFAPYLAFIGLGLVTVIVLAVRR